MPNAVAAALLMVWGASMALSGLGLGASLAARWLNSYWPVLFLAIGLVGLVPARLWGKGRSFYAGLSAASLAVLAMSVRLPGLNVANLVWAAVIMGAGIWLVGRHRWWRW